MRDKKSVNAIPLRTRDQESSAWKNLICRAQVERCFVSKMPLSKRYMNLDTDLDGLQKAIVEELQKNRELKVVNELKGEINGKPFRSITATRKSVPRAIVGALREVTVTMTGDPNDFMLEIHTGAWFRNLALPGSAGLLAGGPLGGMAVAGVSSLIAYDYQMTLWKRIRELVKQYSKKELTLPKVMVYPPYF